MTYRDRYAAGATLAVCLDHLRLPDVVVLGLVRGGMPVAAAVAAHLDRPLDALVVRKLGIPWAPEVAFGAVGPGGVRVLNEEIAERLDPGAIHAVTVRERRELERRERRYRLGRPAVDLTGRTAVVADDGLATGASARAAVAVVRSIGAARVVFAVPVGSAEAVKRLRRLADDVVCPLVPDRFGAVSRFYDDFGQVSDAEVIQLLGSV